MTGTTTVVVDTALDLRHHDKGFEAHLAASPATLKTVRRLLDTVLTDGGADGDLVGTAQLIVSELIGNAVRAAGDGVHLLVEAYPVADGVTVNVHDPLADQLPRRSGQTMDDTDAESGRGLLLLDLLAPGWTVEPSPVGKQIHCTVSAR